MNYPLPELRTRGKTLPSIVLIVWVAVQVCIPPTDSSPSSKPITSQQPATLDLSPHRNSASLLLAESPLSFEQNLGQTDEQVKFFARGNGYTVFLTSTEAVIQWRSANDGMRDTSAQSEIRNPKSEIIRMKLVGQAVQPKVTGLDELPGTVNYFTGSDPTEWRSRIPTYARVKYEDVYPGVDLIYYGNRQQLEYDFVLQPGADPNVIALAFEGADELEVNVEGDLVVSTSAGHLRQRKPFVYQNTGGAKPEVSGYYVLHDNERVGFRVDDYDRAEPLIIDPVLDYSTPLGGSRDDIGLGVAIDANGSAYIAGYTTSQNFPPANPIQRSLSGGLDAFVVKLNPEGTALVYATYLGGSSGDGGESLTVDASGNAYIAGETLSTNFPTVNPLQRLKAGNSDVFLAKLNPQGTALIYSTYLGGTGNEDAFDIALDASGGIYLTGDTNSVNFPTMSPLQRLLGGGFDAFVAKLNPDGATLAYSTYLGALGTDSGRSIVLDASGNAYVTGFTNSVAFPITNPIQRLIGGGTDAFVAKLTPDGTALRYSTYLGGLGTDTGVGIAVDPTGSAYVTGITNSTNFPTASPLQRQLGGGSDAFVVKINPEGTAFAYATYLGGSRNERGFGIAVDGSGNAHLTGDTASTGFPRVNPVQPRPGGGTDAFLVKLNSDGLVFLLATTFGGSATDSGFAIALDADGNVYLTGNTNSANVPMMTPIQPRLGGGFDVFVAKIAP
jgi:hypothetical protein